jgi:hypothetical protein
VVMAVGQVVIVFLQTIDEEQILKYSLILKG